MSRYTKKPEKAVKSDTSKAKAALTSAGYSDSSD